MTVFRAAIVQMRSGTEPERNIETLEERVSEAAAAGADYVQTPEMTGCLQRSRTALHAHLCHEADDPVLAAAARLARAYRVHLHIGSTAVALEDGRVANRGVLFGPDGTWLARYDKIHMFDVDLGDGESWRESRTYRPGNEARVVDAGFRDGTARLGLAICYDLRFANLFRDQAMAGAHVLTAPSAFLQATGSRHWHVLLRARAIENGAYMIAAAQGGLHEDGRRTYGHSLVVDPDGAIIAEIEGDEPGLAVVDIDTDAVKAARSRIPNLANSVPFTLGPLPS